MKDTDIHAQSVLLGWCDRAKSLISDTHHGEGYGEAVEVVFELVEELGFDLFDVGTIAQSWKQQSSSSMYCRDINPEAA